MDKLLTAFWIVPPSMDGVCGYGVTAFTLADACDIVRSRGFQLPDDLSTLQLLKACEQKNSIKAT